MVLVVGSDLRAAKKRREVGGERRCIVLGGGVLSQVVSGERLAGLLGFGGWYRFKSGLEEKHCCW
jgi:hypothetical protein